MELPSSRPYRSEEQECTIGKLDMAPIGCAKLARADTREVNRPWLLPRLPPIRRAGEVGPLHVVALPGDELQEREKDLPTPQRNQVVVVGSMGRVDGNNGLRPCLSRISGF